MSSTTLEKQWITKAGLEARVLILLSDFEKDAGRQMHRCGYVGVPQDNPLWGKHYSDQLDLISKTQADSTILDKQSPILLLTAGCGADDDESVRRSLDIIINVHGGIPFSSAGFNDNLPGPNWWFGFDCAHYMDTPIEPPYYASGFADEGVVRSLEYCIDECESMAEQLVALTAPKLLENKDE